MKFEIRLGIIACWPIIAVAVILLGRSSFFSLPGDSVESLVSAHQWLAVITVLYIFNYLAAWRYSSSWPLSMSRMLLWAVIAYLCISNIIDLLGENWSIAGQILGLSGEVPGDGGSAVVIEMRWRLAVWAAALAMSCVCIGIGFEANGTEE
ncbi:MAG: hypothetical protein GY847_04020 [Proteobacteria bacterium]|nr:hypothetical protein [Pseudomonadota bacterium]